MDQVTQLYQDVWGALGDAYDAVAGFFDLLEAVIWGQMYQAGIPVQMQPVLLGAVWLLLLFVAFRLMFGLLRVIAGLVLVLLLFHLLRHYI